jgi:hypothetical protein
MGRVAQQRHPPGRPPGNRVPVVQRPLVPGRPGREESRQLLMPPRVAGDHLVPRALCHPRFVPVGVVVIVRDDVDELLAAQRVEHDRAVRPEPLRVVGRQVSWHPAAHGRRRDHRPVADLPGEPGRVRSEQRRPDRGVNPVRPDHQVRRGGSPVREPHQRHVSRGLRGHAPPAQRHHTRWQRGGEHVEQVGPVHRGRLDAEQRHLPRPARPGDDPPGDPVPGDRELGPPGDRPDGLLDPDEPQHPHRVGVQRDPGPDLPQFRCRLEDRHLGPGPQQCDRRGKPPDAAPDDRNPCHAPIFSPPPPAPQSCATTEINQDRL